jgi:hypothetical protein
MHNPTLLRDASARTPSDAINVLYKQDMSSVDGITAAIAALERLMPGYVRPVAHGSGILGASGRVQVEVFNRGGHDFPAMVLASICGYTAGTEVVLLSARQLELAVSVMAPAEACHAFQHPNLAAWRRILEQLRREPGAAAAVAFIGDGRSPSSNKIIEAFLCTR